MKFCTRWTVCLGILLLAACGSAFTLGMGTVTITGLAPGQSILCGQTAAQVQFVGQGFLSEHGLEVTIRWDALEGTPFEDGTAASTETMGTVLSDTLFEAELPDVFGTIPVRVTIILPGGNEGTSPAITLEIGGVLGPPDAVDDAYGAIGNVQLVVPAVTGVLFNDENGDCLPGEESEEEEEESDKFGAGAGALTTGTVLDYDETTALGGSVVMQPDGSFVYTPPVGAGIPDLGDLLEPAQDTFQYTLEQPDGQTDTATVTIDICETVWFIDSNASPGGTGQMHDPFDSLTAFMAQQGGPDGDDPEPGDWIFVYEGSGALYDGGITLLDDQKLIGQGADLVVCGQTLVTATVRPQLTNQLGVSLDLHCIELANANRIDGLDVVGPAGNGIHGVDVSGPTTVDRCTVSGCGGDGVYLEGVLVGPFDFSPDTRVEQCDLSAVYISDGREEEGNGTPPQLQGLTSGGFTFEGDISQVDAGPAITVFGTAPGTTITFQNGSIDYDGDTFSAIDLSAVSGTFTCTSPQTILGEPFSGIFIDFSDGTFVFDDTVIDVYDDGFSGAGVDLGNVGGASLSFNDLEITIDGDPEAVAGGFGIFMGNLGMGGPTGLTTPHLATGPTNIDVTGDSSISMTEAEGAVVCFSTDPASPPVLDMTFTSITVDGAPQMGGFQFGSCQGTFEVTGTTTIEDFDGAGVLVFPDGDLDLTFATLDISGGSGIGRAVDIVSNTGLLTVAGGTWDDFTYHGLAMDDSRAAINNVAFSNITLDVIQLNGICTVSGSGNTATTYGTLCDSAGATVTGSISFTTPSTTCP